MAASPILDLLRHGQEGLLDVGCVLCRRLQERDGQLVCEFLKRLCKRVWRVTRRAADKREKYLCDAILDDLLPGEIRLIAHEQLVNAL